MNPLNPSDRDCRIAKRQLAVGNQAAAGAPAARIATNLGVAHTGRHARCAGRAERLERESATGSAGRGASSAAHRRRSGNRNRAAPTPPTCGTATTASSPARRASPPCASTACAHTGDRWRWARFFDHLQIRCFAGEPMRTVATVGRMDCTAADLLGYWRWRMRRDTPPAVLGYVRALESARSARFEHGEIG